MHRCERKIDIEIVNRRVNALLKDSKCCHRLLPFWNSPFATLQDTELSLHGSQCGLAPKFSVEAVNNFKADGGMNLSKCGGLDIMQTAVS